MIKEKIYAYGLCINESFNIRGEGGVFGLPRECIGRRKALLGTRAKSRPLVRRRLL
jgi:hypothetical protein